MQEKEGPRLEEGEVPEEEIWGVRLGTSGKLQALISAVKELTKVVKNGFEELRML